MSKADTHVGPSALPANAASGERKHRLSFASVVLLLFAVGSAATGQILLKHGMTRASQGVGSSLLVRAATSGWVLAGLAIFAISAIAWLSTLTRVPLSVAYPFNALGFLAILAASAYLLDERTNVWTWVGTLVVVAGLVLVVATKPTP